jgi:hypothetical protein
MSEFERLTASEPSSGENLMKTITLLFGACALVVLPLGTAAAGPCTTEIENLTKLLASRDAGAGPTAGPVGTTTGQHPPTSAMGAADSSTAASAAAAESAKPQHPPTAAMNQATQGGGASPRAGDTVREQNPPTAAMNEATHGRSARAIFSRCSRRACGRRVRGGTASGVDVVLFIGNRALSLKPLASAK